MSYVENQGVYAVNCASLDEVRTEHTLIQERCQCRHTESNSNLIVQAEKKGDKTPWTSAAQIQEMKTRRGRTTSPHGSISQEDVRVRKVRKQCSEGKYKMLSLKSASRLVPGIGIRGGPGGRYSQVAMVSLLKFICSESFF